MSPIGTHLGILAQPAAAAAGGDLVNTNSININGMRFLNTGINGNGGGGVGSTFTYTCWFKMPSAVSSTVILFTCDIDPGNGYFRFSLLNSFLFFENQTSEASILRRDQVWTNPNGYRDDAWHHLVLHSNNYTTNASDLTIYVDGVDVGTVLRDEVKPTAWSFDGNNTQYLNTGAVTGARITQIGYFDSIVSAATLYNGGTPLDLNSLGTPPIEWYQFVNNLNNDGSSGVHGALSAGTPSYSTDHP